MCRQILGIADGISSSPGALLPARKKRSLSSNSVISGNGKCERPTAGVLRSMSPADGIEHKRFLARTSRFASRETARGASGFCKSFRDGARNDPMDQCQLTIL